MRPCSAWHFVEGANVVFEGYVSSTKQRVFRDLRSADPVHTEAAEIVAGGIPGHQIPKWWQDQQGLRFDVAYGFYAFGVTVI